MKCLIEALGRATALSDVSAGQNAHVEGGRSLHPATGLRNTRSLRKLVHHGQVCQDPEENTNQ